MNTTKKGDAFEQRSYEIIRKAITKGDLGIIASQCKVFAKKGYYSEARKSDIIFDLTIEVWPQGAQRYVHLFVIECKSYSTKPVPVGDLEAFNSKIAQVAGVNVKGIFITDNTFQQGAYTYGESRGMMMITVNYDDSYNILLHNIYRLRQAESKIESWDDIVEGILTEAFNKECVVQGLQRLSAKTIATRAEDVLNEFDPDILNNNTAVPFEKLIRFLEKRYSIETDFTCDLGATEKHILPLAAFDRERNLILVDRSFYGTERFPFLFFHEVGHFFLHRHLKINQKAYNSFKESEYNFRTEKHEFTNPRHWIEWQANQFSSALIVPEQSLKSKVIEYQIVNGIRNKGTIYFDTQRVNLVEFYDIVSYLASYFGVSQMNIKCRLRDVGILKQGTGIRVNHWSTIRYSD